MGSMKQQRGATICWRGMFRFGLAVCLFFIILFAYHRNKQAAATRQEAANEKRRLAIERAKLPFAVYRGILGGRPFKVEEYRPYRGE